MSIKLTIETATRILKAYGFSAAKALEIAIDYERGKEHARHYVGLAISSAVRSAA